MKIYRIKLSDNLQPLKQKHLYPIHNKDYGVEQDFDIWLHKQKNILTNNPLEADWHYLPVYWTRWHINHNFAENGEGISELNELIEDSLIDENRTFTISQFDGGTLSKYKNIVDFTAARTINSGIDIPIISTPHKKTPIALKKKYIASFNGSFDTHPIRVKLNEKYEHSSNVLVQGNLPTRFLKRLFWAKSFNINTMASYVALCPRGSSYNSFRFFEAMQLGTAPCLIGDKDVRPFKNFIPWDEMSYYVSTIDELDNLLCTLNKAEALRKGKKAYCYYKNEIFYQKWCKYVLKELESQMMK